MSNLETILLCVLLIAIIALIVVIFLIKRDTDKILLKKLKDIDDDNTFQAKLTVLKSEIDSGHQQLLDEKISRHREYYIADAIKRSGTITKGKIIEHFAPFLIDDYYNPNEIVFIGSPIDLISFSNIDSDKEVTIDFLEIKTGGSSLNRKQKLIRSAILNKRVHYKKIMLK